jgi:hypothetical protein
MDILGPGWHSEQEANWSGASSFSLVVPHRRAFRWCTSEKSSARCYQFTTIAPVETGSCNGLAIELAIDRQSD